MQSGQQFDPEKAVPAFGNQMGDSYGQSLLSSPFATVLPPVARHLPPVHGIEFQPSEVCPRNFIIFDQTDQRSQIMYHPAIAHKFSGPGLNNYATSIQEDFEGRGVNGVETEISSSLKEDSDDIDALLSMEEEEEEECNEEELSTARTYGNYGSSSPDSCSNYGLKPKKSGSVQKSSGSSSSCNSERKRQKMNKMVKTLRGIVPGGDQMNTVTVLDEAVRYLKSLKVEVQKLGVGNFKN